MWCSKANAAAPVREVTSSFVKMLLRCRATVFSLRNSSVAISGLVLPAATRRKHLDLACSEPTGMGGGHQCRGFALSRCRAEFREAAPRDRELGSGGLVVAEGA